MIAAAALALALVAATDTTGTGWLIGNGVTHLDASYWSVQFYDQNTMDKTSYYVEKTVAELSAATGVEYKVHKTFTHANDATCPGVTPGGGHRLIVELDMASSRSNATICKGANGEATSSHLTLSGQNWGVKTRNGCYGCYKKNVTSHEMGHSMGLSHPDWDRNVGAYVENGCELSGTNPLMCGQAWGGYSSYDYAHKYTSYDVNGLKQLVLNRP